MSPLDMSWMPPAEEWDFRAVTAEECGLACYWEYSRTLCQGGKNPESWVAGNYLLLCPFLCYSGGEREPLAWTLLSRKERSRIRECMFIPAAIRIMPLNEFIDESLRSADGDHRKALERMRCPATVVWANFQGHGTEKVIEGFNAWARQGAENSLVSCAGRLQRHLSIASSGFLLTVLKGRGAKSV